MLRRTRRIFRPTEVIPASTELDEQSRRVPAGLPQHKSMPRQVLALAIWPFFEQIMGYLVGLVDTGLAGHISVATTNAVGVASYLMWLMGMLVGAVGVGSTALIARSVGAGRWSRGRLWLAQSVAVAVLWGLLLGAILFFGAPYIARISGLSGASLDACIVYLRIIALAGPANAVLYIANACQRGAGDTRTPFLIMILVNTVNTSLSILLVAEWSPIGGHGLAGVAWGTLAAWYVGAATVLLSLTQGWGKLRLLWSKVRLRWGLTRRLVRVGLPNLLENGGHWIGNFLLLVIVGYLPNDAAVGAHIIGIRLEAVSFLPGFAIGMAAATMTGQYLGAGDPANARKAVGWCWIFCAALMVTMGVVFMVVPHWLVRIVTDQAAFLELCPKLLFHAGWAQIGFATHLVLSAAIRGAGDTRTAMRLTYFCTFVVRLPLVCLFAIYFGWGLEGVWIASAIEMCVRGLVFLARFLHGGWIKVKL